jgi:hypothetical protein
MTSRVPAIALSAALAVFGFSVATAQGAQPAASAASAAPAAPPPLKNLQVFPKDISRPELISNMRFFTQSLGVRCTFCHVGAEGQPPSTFDFASDAKKEKLIARKMLLMVQRINSQDFGVQPTMANMKVTCFTCHRRLDQAADGAARANQRPGCEPPSCAAQVGTRHQLRAGPVSEH